MSSMNLLGNHYLGSEYSVTEARIFFEIYENEGCNAAHIAKAMNIDKSYLSRIIKSHEKNGYIRRIASESDGRSYYLYLTESGVRRAEDFIRKSDEEIGEIIEPLANEECVSLVQALSMVIDLLNESRKQREGE
jgi:Transcriptional regulators